MHFYWLSLCEEQVSTDQKSSQNRTASCQKNSSMEYELQQKFEQDILRYNLYNYTTSANHVAIFSIDKHTYNNVIKIRPSNRTDTKIKELIT